VKLTPRQLETHLAAGVGAVYLVSSDEPLLLDETLDRIRGAARASGCDEREVHVAERGFDWEQLRASLANLSLFSSRQLIELRLPTGKPGDVGARQLSAIADDPPADKTLVVITPALKGASQKSKWVQKLADAGAWIMLRAPSTEELPAWLAGRLKRAGLGCEPDALQLLASRVEGNLLAAKQEIDKLVLLAEGRQVNLDMVRASVADGARFDVFQLADSALAGDAARMARILQHLEQEGVAATLVLWSLAREITVVCEVAHRVARGDSPGRAMTAAGVWRSREALVGAAVRRAGLGGARALVAQAACVDSIVKGARYGRPWPALLELGLALAAGRPAVETAA
jgi:DNA polymerase-3 subunit delta